MRNTVRRYVTILSLSFGRTLNNKDAQHNVQLTVGTRRVFEQFVWLGVGSFNVALSRPAHQVANAHR